MGSICRIGNRSQDFVSIDGRVLGDIPEMAWFGDDLRAGSCKVRPGVEVIAKRVALVLVTIWLSGCATVSSDGGSLGVCPPVVEYSREFQARVAEQLALLPEGSAIEEMLSDYTVMRQQARLCSRP